MIKGVRRPDEVSGLGLGNRLLIRVGALLKKGLAISPAALEAARPGSAVERLLLDAEVFVNAAKVDAATIARLCAAHPELKNTLLTLTTSDDGVRVICLQEELDAGAEWAATAPAEKPSAPEDPAPMQPQALTTVPPAMLARSQPAPAPATELFSNAEIDRWRLKMMTASDPAERMEAVRTLCLAPLPAPDKFQVLLQGLSDKDPAMRAEAAGLLVRLGADKDLSEALAGLNGPDPARRKAAAERMQSLLRRPATDLDIGSIAVAALAMLRTRFDPALINPLLDMLRACAPAVARNAERLSEIVRVITGLIGTSANEKTTSQELDALLCTAQRLTAALGAASPDSLRPAIASELERCSDMVTEAFLLQALLDLPPAGDEDEQKLLKLSAAYVAREMEEGRASRAIGTRMSRRGDRALLAICDAFSTAHLGAQKYFLILFDDIYRLNKPSTAALDRAAKVVLHAVEAGSQGLRMSAMECRFITDIQVDEATRTSLTRAFLSSISDFLFRTDIEKVEFSIARLGLPAVAPLLERLAPERPAIERTRAVRLLGEWSLNVRAPSGQLARMQECVNNVLRQLQALSLDENFPDRGELLCALGKLVSSPAASRDADAVVTRTLLDAARGTDAVVVPRALEGLTYVAGSRRAHAELINATAELLRHVLDELSLEIDTEMKKVAGELVIEITGGEKYTRVLPILLEGMSRVACSSSCPPAIMRDIGQILLGRWQKIGRGQLMWGPANTILLIKALKQLGCHRGFPPELRLEVLRNFAPRHVQTPVLHAITEILAAADNPETAVGAVTIGYAILGRGKDGRFSPEDREDILTALSRIAGRKCLGAANPEAQQKAHALRKQIIDELIKGVKDIVAGAYDRLNTLRQSANVPDDLRHDIERRLKEYEALVLR
ncbi:MAG TPA: HEAT repeat domain-containing protein [Planctomycetota bacterium]|jgi:hypothetical protein